MIDQQWCIFRSPRGWLASDELSSANYALVHKLCRRGEIRGAYCDEESETFQSALAFDPLQSDSSLTVRLAVVWILQSLLAIRI